MVCPENYLIGGLKDQVKPRHTTAKMYSILRCQGELKPLY